MANIKSNTGTANLIATSIARSLDGLSTGGVITSDTQTTISGNTNATEAVQTLTEATDSVLQAVGQASTNLQSVASEFEAMDKAAREIFSSPIPNLNTGISSGSQGAGRKVSQGLFTNPIPTFKGGSN